MRGSRVGAYAPWQLRDYLIDRGAPTIIVSALFGYIGIGAMLNGVTASIGRMSPAQLAARGGAEVVRASMVHDLSVSFLDNFLGVVVFLGALFAMNGIVANDRKTGFYRFLFAKPMSPMRYYGQGFLVHWGGYAMVVALLAIVYGLLVTPVLSLTLVGTMVLMFLCYAGIAFALSAAARWDWLSLVTVTVFATYAWQRWGTSENALAKLLYLLPPLDRTSKVYHALSLGEAPPWNLVAWLAGYGAACWVIGLLVLRVRRLAIA